MAAADGAAGRSRLRTPRSRVARSGWLEEQAIEAGPGQDPLDRRLRAAQLDLGLRRALGHVLAERMEGAPARVRIRRRLAVHQAHDRMEGDEPGAGHEPQVRQVEQQVPGARVVQPAGRDR